MARVGRKRHVQVPLLNRKGSGPARGRERRGLRRAPRRADGTAARPVGRPRKAGRRNTEHRSRPEVRASRPVHVVLRVVREVGNLRRREGYRALRRATVVVARRGDVGSAAGARAATSARLHGDIRRAGREFGIFRIVHLSIQRDHVHLLVEADDRVALARGLQAFQISAAKHLNAAVRGLDGRRRRGRVFGDRYHASVITNPRQARNALAYVLNNWRKHRVDRAGGWRVDPYSTGASFDGWRAWDLGRDGTVETGWRRPPDDLVLVAWAPRSWLLRVGWERHGAIAVAEVPSRPAWLELGSS